MGHRVVRVIALQRYRIHVWFADGVHGEIDLSHLAGQGVFQAWDEPDFFEQVFVNPEFHCVTWPGELDLDPTVIHASITGEALPGIERAAPTPAQTAPTQTRAAS